MDFRIKILFNIFKYYFPFAITTQLTILKIERKMKICEQKLNTQSIFNNQINRFKYKWRYKCICLETIKLQERNSANPIKVRLVS